MPRPVWLPVWPRVWLRVCCALSVDPTLGSPETTEADAMQTEGQATWPVTVRGSNGAQHAGATPLGPEALGYLTWTPDGYVFVPVVRGDPTPLALLDLREWISEFEEGCF